MSIRFVHKHYHKRRQLNYYINFSIACTNCCVLYFTASEIMRIKAQLVAVMFYIFLRECTHCGVIKTNLKYHIMSAIEWRNGFPY